MPGVAFLERDHVLDLARLALDRADGERGRAIEAFFLPERVPAAALLDLAAPLPEVGLIHTLDTTASLDEVTALFVRRAAVPGDLVRRLPGLRLIQRLGESTDGIDLDAIARAGVELSCLPRQTLVQVAEHVVLLALALLRRLAAAPGVIARFAPGKIDQVSYNWGGITPIETLQGKTFGIVGMGEIGRLLAPRAKAFGATVLYDKRTRLAEAEEERLGVRHVSRAELLARSDVVSMHYPPTRENHRIADAHFFGAMRPGAMFINTARGALVNEAALAAALASGHLAGAALDVHAREPRGGMSPFQAGTNVILTPHVAGGSRAQVLPEIGAMLDNLHRVLRGELPAAGRIDLRTYV